MITHASTLEGIHSLEGYMLTYGEQLQQNALDSLDPLHVPGRDPLLEFAINRQCFEPQAHVVTAAVKTLRRRKSVFISAEMGTGKTQMGMAAIHEYARSRGRQGYRCIIYCPGQLTSKWQRELEQTIPGVKVHQVRKWTDLIKLHVRSKPKQPTFYVISRERACLGAKWQHTAPTRKCDTAEIEMPGPNDTTLHLRVPSKVVRCPKCGRVVTNKDGEPYTPATMGKSRVTCEFIQITADGQNPEGCGAPLWQYNREINRWCPADYIKRKMRGFFDYLIVDEIHEMKGGGNIARANAAGKMFAACKKMIGLTGTLLGGKAEDLRYLLMRYNAASMQVDGYDWDSQMPFNEDYGRIEERVTTKSGGDDGADNRMSCGKAAKNKKNKVVKPGIMPTLFGRHVMENSIFLALDEMSDELPPLIEDTVAVPMDEDLTEAYNFVRNRLEDENRRMIQKGDRRLMSTMMQTLLCYPDHPFGFGQVGYHDTSPDGKDRRFMPVVTCPDLPRERIYPKEQALIDTVLTERNAGRQCWVYVQYTGDRNVAARLKEILTRAGLRAKVLYSDTVKVENREEWIYQQGKDADVVISHPKLVETGLDLFAKDGNHNFSTLIFYETGYNAFTLRQAARRSWRIGQTLDCKVIYMYYEKATQQAAMELMGRKVEAATAIEGKFSAQGLMAMIGEADGEEGADDMALAKAMAEKIDGSSIQRKWARVTQSSKPRPAVVDTQEPRPIHVPPQPAPQPKRKSVPKPQPVAVAAAVDSDWEDIFAAAKWLLD